MDENKKGSDLMKPLELTPEERAVLLQCRRRSMIRGMVSGSGVCMLLFWLRAQGRVPSVVNQFPGFFYAMAFFGPFSAGFGSYQKICYQKIMSLENSTLKTRAEQFEKDMHDRMARRHKRVPEGDYSQKQLKHPPPASPPSRLPKQETAPPHPNVELNEGPSINMKTYSRDRTMLDTKEETKEQPDAFSSEKGQAPVEIPDPQEIPRKRGRTFDEIREENRHRNSQQQRYPTSRQPGSGSGDERKRRNKYGDIIEP